MRAKVEVKGPAVSYASALYPEGHTIEIISGANIHW